MSVRYTAIAALGLARLDAADRRRVLAGDDLPDLLPGILGLALAGRDLGALALSVWATSEIARVAPDAVRREEDRVVRALDRLVAATRSQAPVRTVEYAWTLVALLAASRAVELSEPAGDEELLLDAARRTADRLVAAQGPSGLFPHQLPADLLNRFRSHVACFADQAYPIQALTRHALATGDDSSLAAAGRAADRLASLQGDRGQWWWHYDWRHGTVVESYPVYTVHQYGLAPMALLELSEAGGPDHRPAVARGLAWLLEPPETESDFIEDDLGVIWRAVGRREPHLMVRRIRSAASAARPGRHLTWLDQVFPPGLVERECRPFELGWQLYAWHTEEPVPADVVELEGPALEPEKGMLALSHSARAAGDGL